MSVTAGVPRPADVDRLVRVPVAFDAFLTMDERHRAEYVEGQAVVSPSPTAGHQRVSRRIANLIEVGCPGLFVVEAVGLWTGAQRSRIPDIIATRTAFEGAWADQSPVIVVEVLSPSTRREDTLRKAVEYRELGVSHYWLVDPERRTLFALANVGDGWDVALTLDEVTQAGVVAIGEHGQVTCDLAALLAP